MNISVNATIGYIVQLIYISDFYAVLFSLNFSNLRITYLEMTFKVISGKLF